MLSEIKTIKGIIYFKLLIIFIFIFILFFIFIKNNIFIQDDITLITSLFKIKSKYKFDEYIKWSKSFLQINASMVIFLDKSLSKEVKNYRPKKYQNKTIWIETEIKNFFSYKKYINNFNITYNIDYEKKLHSVPLYLIWAEKCYFVRRAIYRNFFKSKCFYWIDIGFFKNSNLNKYLNNWPSKNKCFEDPRVIMNSMRKISNEEILELKKLEPKYYNEFIKKLNVGGGLFGGTQKYLNEFIKLYYKTISKFIKKSLFIGKDQNLFAYISYLNQDIVNLIYSGKWKYLALYIYNSTF